MEMIQIPQKEIQSEMFCIDNDYDFADMLEKLLGYEVGQYARKLAIAFEEADAYVDYLYPLEDENDELKKQLKKKRHTFTFVFGKE
jgi:hypothetical protein